MDPQQTLGIAVLEALQAAGVREIFGIPGDFVLPLFKVVEESKRLPLYTLSHEPSVGFAADGAARWHGRPSAAVVTYGAGALNMVNPVAAAYAEKSPVVVISGGPGISEDHTELLLHHQAKRLDSQFEIYREVTCAQTRLSDLATAPSELARVLANCRTESRPVYIEVPRDLVGQPCGPATSDDPHRKLPQPGFDPEAIAACVDEIEARIRAARSPVLMVGVEIRRFNLERQVAQLAARLGIPVVTSFMGRGLLVDSKAPLVGTYLGVAGESAITDLVEQSDALVLLGVILSDTNLGTSKRKIDLRRCVQVRDGQVMLGFHTYPQIPLAELLRHFLQRSIVPCRGGSSRPAIRPAAADAADPAELTPDAVAEGLNRAWPRNRPLLLSADVGDCLFTAMSVERAHLVAPGYYASMGFGVPAGLGLQVATGERVVILVGDGAFQMTGWELGNCVRYGWDPLVIVLNNSGWEMLRTFQPESQFNLLNTWDFAALAKALGGHGVRVTSYQAYKQALRQALARRGTFELIEVLLPRGSVSHTMSRYAEGLKALRQNLLSAHSWVPGDRQNAASTST